MVDEEALRNLRDGAALCVRVAADEYGLQLDFRSRVLRLPMSSAASCGSDTR